MLNRQYNKMIVILGQRGTGKTNWIYKNLSSFEPFVLVDPVFDEKFDKCNLLKIKSVDEALKMFRHGNPNRVYMAPNLMTFEFFCGVLLARGNMTLIVDEVNHYATSYYISDNFKKLVLTGRHRNISLIVVGQRPKNIAPVIRSQANRYIIFPISGEDAKDLEQNVGTEVRNKIPDLKLYYSGENVIASDYIDYDGRTHLYTIQKLEHLQRNIQPALYETNLDKPEEIEDNEVSS